MNTRPNRIQTPQLSPAGIEALGDSSAGITFAAAPETRNQDRERIENILEAVRGMGPQDTLLSVLRKVDQDAAAEHAVTVRAQVEQDARNEVAAYAAKLMGTLMARHGLVIQPPGVTPQPSHLPEF